MGFLKRAWKGEEPLWKVFWMAGLAVPLAAGFVIGILISVLPSLTLPILILLIVYVIWWWVAMWRCAFNGKTRFWGYAARVYVILGPLLILLVSVTIGKELLIAAQCDAQMEKEAAAAGVEKKAYIHQHINECFEAKGSEMRLQSLPAGSEAYAKSCKDDYVKQFPGKDPDGFFALNPKMLKECVESKLALDRGNGNVRIRIPAEVANDPAAPQCIQHLMDYAKSQNVDPQIYVSQNNEWVINCVKQQRSGGRQ